MLRCLTVVAASLAVTGCRSHRSSTPREVPPGSSTARAPKITAQPIPGLEAPDLQSRLTGIGFTGGPPNTAVADFVTTTSKRADATVTTYGRGLTDVVEVVAQADTKAAVPVLGAVATTPLSKAEGTRALAWVEAEVAKGPLSATKPRTVESTYGGQRYRLLITSSTATLTIGRLHA